MIKPALQIQDSRAPSDVFLSRLGEFSRTPPHASIKGFTPVPHSPNALGDAANGQGLDHG